MTSILYICNKNDVFLKAHVKNLDPAKYNVKILSLAHGELIDRSKGKTDTILKIKDTYPHVIRYSFRYLNALLFMISFSKQKFDVVHILNIKRENFFLIPYLRKRCKKIIITVFGRSTYIYPSKRILFARVYKFVDVFVFSNRSIIKEFLLINNKVAASKLVEGIPPMDNYSLIETKQRNENIREFIKKYNIESGLIRISCSSTISSYDQHDNVIEAIKNLQSRDKVQLMFLLTYGGTKEEQQRIIDLIHRELSGFNTRIFTSFLTTEELNSYRALTDIYINMRSTDQMAGALLESLFEGALLISGKWLNYETLDDLGIHYQKVKDFENLGYIVDESIANIDEIKTKYSKDNAKKIADAFSLEVVLKKWEELYKSESD